VTRTTYAFALLLVIAVGLAIAGCGGSSGDGSGSAYGGGNSGESTASTTTATAPSGAGVTFVALGNSPDLGQILVDSKGFTLYDFDKDKGTTSACYGGCAKVWPPLLTDGAPQPSNGASASKLGTTKRSDGTEQVTYAGHPLYTYVADKKPGDASGNDFSSFGAQWYALKGSGEEAEG
jgi:predicted lipoprotein with Yx(FWY)xxD motif